MSGAKFKSRAAVEAYLRRLAEPPAVLPPVPKPLKPARSTRTKSTTRRRAS